MFGLDLSKNSMGKRTRVQTRNVEKKTRECKLHCVGTVRERSVHKEVWSPCGVLWVSSVRKRTAACFDRREVVSDRRCLLDAVDSRRFRDRIPVSVLNRS